MIEQQLNELHELLIKLKDQLYNNESKVVAKDYVWQAIEKIRELQNKIKDGQNEKCS